MPRQNSTEMERIMRRKRWGPEWHRWKKKARGPSAGLNKYLHFVLPSVSGEVYDPTLLLQSVPRVFILCFIFICTSRPHAPHFQFCCTIYCVLRCIGCADPLQGYVWALFLNFSFLSVSVFYFSSHKHAYRKSICQQLCFYILSSRGVWYKGR